MLVSSEHDWCFFVCGFGIFSLFLFVVWPCMSILEAILAMAEFTSL